MKSWYVRTEGGAMEVDLRDVPEPRPAPGQVRVRIHAAALNRGEFIAGHGLHAAGAAKPAGFEAAGEVAALGEGVTALREGDRVMGRVDGAFSEAGTMWVDEAMRVPDALSWEQAAAFTVVHLTVHDALIAQGRLAAGEWMLVPGISSGVGVAALQVARALGARTIGLSGSTDKLARLRTMGLEVGIPIRGPGFVPAVREVVGERGADLAVNPVGASVLPDCVELLGFEGRLATVGYVDGVVSAPLDVLALHKKRLQLFGVSNKMRQMTHRVAAVRALARDLLPMAADGRISPVVDRVFGFAELPDAQRMMEANTHLGKLVLRIA
ncbi:MAG: zinc-binding alcohol dehydrogenase family protein [Burkholderiales bacterium]|jgi:NADPH:quinone reductase-like Zn-dependent oxidoreductase|nr:zinc-binding dehydrogenase [Burkholderiales bacterium]MCZ8107959.1 zinc-binding dehydrogenase [Burkholderiales bacterium]